VILIAVTSQARPGSGITEFAVGGWKEAGLLKPSVVKPILATVDRHLILRKLGTLRDDDLRAVERTLSAILGV
jgi:mRNA interferase MazF